LVCLKVITLSDFHCKTLTYGTLAPVDGLQPHGPFYQKFSENLRSTHLVHVYDPNLVFANRVPILSILINDL